MLKWFLKTEPSFDIGIFITLVISIIGFWHKGKKDKEESKKQKERYEKESEERFKSIEKQISMQKEVEKEMFIRTYRIPKLEESILFCSEFELQIIEILKIIKEQQSVREEEDKKILAIYLEMNKSFDRFIIQEDLFMEFDEMDNEFFRKFETGNIFKEFDKKYKELEKYITPDKKTTCIDTNSIVELVSDAVENQKTIKGNIEFTNIQISDVKGKIEVFKEILDKYRLILEYFKKFNLFMLRKKVEEKDSKEFLDKIKKEYDCKNKKI